MKIFQRQSKIIELIRQKERVTVNELATMLDISRETIRRDLTDLSNKGKIQKIHGGAMLPRVMGEDSYQQRMTENSEAKAKVAKEASFLFAKGETIFIDTGSTTLYFAEALAAASGLTIITNSTDIARTISASGTGNKVFLLGGEFSSDNNQTVGTITAAQIRSFRAHHTVLTIAAMDERAGAMDFNIEEAQVARAMIAQSETLTILVDDTKFDKIASFEVCTFSQIDRIVCNTAPTGKLLMELEAAGVEIILSQ